MTGKRWPNLFMAGVAKAGTTSLHRYLGEHPEIAMSRPKETYFFSDHWDGAEGDQEALSKATEAYLECFTHGEDERYLGESTPDYLWHPKAPERIASRCHEPRFIVSLRDPIERAHSDWAMATNRSGETRSFLKRVNDELDPDPANPKPTGVVNPGRYGTHLKRLIGTVGEDHVHIVLFEDLKKDPLALLEDIASFLGVSRDGMHTVDYETVHNPYGEARNRLAAWALDASLLHAIARGVLPESVRIWLGEHALVKKTGKPPLEPEAKAKLVDYYEPEIRETETLLGRSLPELKGTW